MMTIVAGMGFLSAGCYALQPAAGAVPVPGTNVALDITDAGRVALGMSMGPGISRVTGRLMSRSGTEYLISVSGVELQRGGFETWRGETVRIDASHVSTFYERRFSKGRTILLSAVLVGAAAVLAKKGLDRSFVDPDSIPIDTITSRRGRGRIPTRSGLPPFLRSINPPRSY